MPARTIDNLGYDASQRYAKDQELLGEQEKIRTPAVFGHPQIDVTRPAFNSELDLLLHVEKKNLVWAEFHPPLGYTEQKRKFFTHQLIPSLKELHEHCIKKITDQESGEQEERDEEKKEKEKKILLTLLDCILDLDKCMIYVNTKRSQYHKG